eukprot:14358-Rhodomonas_salina.1
MTRIHVPPSSSRRSCALIVATDLARRVASGRVTGDRAFTGDASAASSLPPSRALLLAGRPSLTGGTAVPLTALGNGDLTDRPLRRAFASTAVAGGAAAERGRAASLSRELEPTTR